MDDLISRQQAVDALREYLINKRVPEDGTLTARLVENEVINKLPSAEPQITHQYCAKVLKKLWDDEVILFCEYDRIMDRLKKRMEVDNDEVGG